jgi:putative xylitol transport system substrate-binding protein
MKKLLLAFALGAGLLQMFASNGHSEPVKVAAAVYGQKAEFVQLWVRAINEQPAVTSGQAKVTVFDGRYSATTQNNQFDTIIAQKFDAIIFIPIDAQAGAAAVKKAHDAGIPVIVSNASVRSTLQNSYIGSNDVLGGEMEAEAVAKKLNGKGNVVIFDGPIGQSAQIERGAGIKKVLQKYPDIKVVEEKTANWSRTESLNLMQNWLTAHPGQINGVIGENDEMALGAIQALKAAKIDPKTLAIAGIDGVSDAIQAVKLGEMASILQDANAQAQGALDLALRAKLGTSYQPQSSIWKQYEGNLSWGQGTAENYAVPWTEVTKENADELLAARRK